MNGAPFESRGEWSILRLAGRQLVLLNRRGDLLCRYSPQETMDIVALLREMAKHSQTRQERLTPDGCVGVRVISGSGRMRVLALVFLTANGAVEHTCHSSDYSALIAALRDELGDRAFGKALARYCGFDDSARLLVRGRGSASDPPPPVRRSFTA